MTEKEYTQEEIEEMRQKTIEFYDSELPFLEKQSKVLNLQASIEEADLRISMAKHRKAQLFAEIAQATERPATQASKEAPKQRTLQKED